MRKLLLRFFALVVAHCFIVDATFAAAANVSCSPQECIAPACQNAVYNQQAIVEALGAARFSGFGAFLSFFREYHNWIVPPFACDAAQVPRVPPRAPGRFRWDTFRGLPNLNVTYAENGEEPVMTRREMVRNGILLGVGGLYTFWRHEQKFRVDKPNQNPVKKMPAGYTEDFEDGHTMRLADKISNLAFGEDGAPADSPGLIRVIHLPGGMESHLVNYLNKKKVLNDENILMHTIDPPGTDRSSPLPDGVLADWADYVEQFIIHKFNGAEFIIVGNSAGGLVGEAIARSTKLPGFKGLVEVASPGQMTYPWEWVLYPPKAVWNFVFIRWLSPRYALSIVDALIDKIQNHWPDYFKEDLDAPGLPPADHFTLNYPGISEMVRIARQSALRFYGAPELIQQIRTITSRLPKKTNDPKNYFHIIVHGVKDPVVPIAVARQKAKRSPRAKTYFIEEEGHELLRLRFGEIMHMAAEAYRGHSRAFRTPAAIPGITSAQAMPFQRAA